MTQTARTFEERFPARPFVALINKIDLASEAELAARASEIELSDVGLVSAKTGSGVADTFSALAATIRRRERE